MLAIYIITTLIAWIVDVALAYVTCLDPMQMQERGTDFMYPASMVPTEADDTHMAEKEMDEHHSKRSKLDTSFTSIQEITGITTFAFSTMLNNALDTALILCLRFDELNTKTNHDLFH